MHTMLLASALSSSASYSSTRKLVEYINQRIHHRIYLIILFKNRNGLLLWSVDRATSNKFRICYSRTTCSTSFYYAYIHHVICILASKILWYIVRLDNMHNNNMHCIYVVPSQVPRQFDCTIIINQPIPPYFLAAANI